MGESPCFRTLTNESGQVIEAPRVYLRRVYDLERPVQGARVLVDRVWPRGVTKEALHLDLWARNLAPSSELRHWFGHDPARWEEFARRYREELTQAEPQAALEEVLRLAGQGDVTLLYGARDEAHNQAVVLQEVIEERLGRR